MKTLFANGFRPANNPFEGRGIRLGAFPGLDLDFTLPPISPPPLPPGDFGLPPAPPAPPPAPPPAAPPPDVFVPNPLQFAFPVTAGYLACPTGPGVYNLLDPVSLAVVRTGVVAPLPVGTTVLGPADGRCVVAPAPAAAYVAPAAAAASPPYELPTGVYVGGAILGLGILALLALS